MSNLSNKRTSALSLQALQSIQELRLRSIDLSPGLWKGEELAFVDFRKIFFEPRARRPFEGEKIAFHGRYIAAS